MESYSLNKLRGLLKRKEYSKLHEEYVNEFERIENRLQNLESKKVRMDIENGFGRPIIWPERNCGKAMIFDEVSVFKRPPSNHVLMTGIISVALTVITFLLCLTFVTLEYLN